MIKELTKKYLRNNTTIVRVCPGDSIHDVECLLIDNYHCYYWNGGDYHQDTQWHVGDIFEHDQYFVISYKKSKDIVVLDLAAFWDPNNEWKTNTISSSTISSRMLFRERKLKRLRKTIKRRCSK